MNKWVVVILMALAFAAGGLSFYKMGQKTAITATPAPLTVATTPIATPSVLPANSSPVPPTRRVKGPNFGTPPKPGTPVAPKSAGPVKGTVKALIFSSQSDGDALTRFPKSTGNVYMTLTPDGVPDEVELVASIRSAMKEGDPFSEPVQSSGPPRRRTFRFAPPAGGWVSGPYQVVVKPAGSDQVLTLTRFEVDKEGAPPPKTFEAPEYLKLMKDTTAQEGSSVFYETDPQIYLQVDSLKVPANIMVRSVWSAVEVEKLTPGELVAVAETLPPGGDQDSLFTFTPVNVRGTSKFLPGSYRVDVYFDQQQVGSQAFFIQPADEAAVGDASATATP
jgi:hypothetical protein